MEAKSTGTSRQDSKRHKGEEGARYPEQQQAQYNSQFAASARSSGRSDINHDDAQPRPHKAAGAADKHEEDEDILDQKVEREWKNSANRSTAEAVISKHPKALATVDGYKINWMNMRDASSGRLMWQSEEWGREMFTTEKAAKIPKDILKCRAVSREINFTSREMIKDFRLEQRIYYRGACIEEWPFRFGFVIPGSTNSWQQVIQAANTDEMLSPDALSGNLIIETSFYDGPLFLCKTIVRIYYV